jgi:hypothetical protein
MMMNCRRPRIVWQGARGTPEQMEAWVRFIQTADAFYGWQAQQRGELHSPLSRDEIEAVAAISIALGVTPAVAVAWLPMGSQRAHAGVGAWAHG